MYKIIKQTVNSGNNIIAESVINYIDCDKDIFVEHIAPMYHNLAVIINNSYKVHGMAKKTKFIAEEIKVNNDVNAIVSSIRETIKHNVDELNKYIEYINRIIKVSNNRNHRIINEGLIDNVNVHDYMFKNVEVVAAVKDNLIIIE